MCERVREKKRERKKEGDEKPVKRIMTTDWKVNRGQGLMPTKIIFKKKAIFTNILSEIR